MATYSRIPLMYHPTNVVLLDDDPKILNDISLIIANDIPYVVDDDPQQIMEYLKTHTYHRDALSALITKEASETRPGAEAFIVDFSQLLAMLVSPERFKKCVYAMIDRAMKRIDGLDFCRKVRSAKFLVKLLLFTAQTTSEDAVEAFNQKIIDGFLVKEGDPDKIAQKINDYIREYTWLQFVDLGEALTGLLSHVLKPLSDEQFINIFETIYRRYKIVEFYLLDSSCSFLIIDALGKAKQLFVRNDADFKECYEVAKDNKAPYEVLQALRGRQMFPYTEDDMGYAEYQSDAWDNIMVAMDKVPGRELYYAVVDRPNVKVFSFHKYQQEIWPQS